MTIENIIIVDCETDGLDPATYATIELGAVLYSARHRCVIESFATMMAAEGNAAEAINRIPAAALADAPAALHAWTRLPWVCSKFDLELPSSKLGASCVEMALAHGVPVVSAHRALTDCMLIARTLENVQAAGHDLQAMLAKAMRPKVKVASLMPYEEGNVTNKAHGFSWEAPPVKAWTRRIAREDIATLPFPVREVSS